MADKWNSERDEQVISGDTDERVRGVAEEDAEFDDSEDLDEEEDEEGGSTF
jgi:hypothetical protein